MFAEEARLGLSDERLVEMLRLMLRIRRFEEQLAKLFKRGKLLGMAELLGREDGDCQGKDGSMHTVDFSLELPGPSPSKKACT